jgi:hypothetical protein
LASDGEVVSCVDASFSGFEVAVEAFRERSPVHGLPVPRFLEDFLDQGWLVEFKTFISPSYFHANHA